MYSQRSSLIATYLTLMIYSLSENVQGLYYGSVGNELQRITPSRHTSTDLSNSNNFGQEVGDLHVYLSRPNNNANKLSNNMILRAMRNGISLHNILNNTELIRRKKIVDKYKLSSTDESISGVLNLAGNKRRYEIDNTPHQAKGRNETIKNSTIDNEEIRPRCFASMFYSIINPGMPPPWILPPKVPVPAPAPVQIIYVTAAPRAKGPSVVYNKPPNPSAASNFFSFNRS